MTKELTSQTVKQYGRAAGADVVGIAAATAFAHAPEGYRPADVLEGCLSVIVLGAACPREVLNDTVEYTANRNAMLTNMTAMAKEVAKQIKAHGHGVKAISGSGGKTVNGMTHGHISLKHAAELTGLGVIGKNYLFTSPKYGNLLWLSAVLTDADLVPDLKVEHKMCDNCDICVKACPSGALDDPNSFGKKECAKFFSMANKKFEIKCFRCRTVCPHRFGIEQHV